LMDASLRIGTGAGFCFARTAELFDLDDDVDYFNWTRPKRGGVDSGGDEIAGVLTPSASREILPITGEECSACEADVEAVGGRAGKSREELAVC